MGTLVSLKWHTLGRCWVGDIVPLIHCIETEAGSKRSWDHHRGGIPMGSMGLGGPGGGAWSTRSLALSGHILSGVFSMVVFTLARGTIW
jgi:hypothetical protein